MYYLMSHRRLLQVAVSCSVLLLILSLFAAPAAAMITMEAETSYDGTEGDQQPVEVSVTLTPEVVHEDVEISLSETTNALIDRETVSSPQPGIEQTGALEFRVDRLEPGEEVTINFDVYPKALQESELSVARVTWQSEQVPEPTVETVTADMSNSPLLQLEAAQERIDELETELADMEQSHQEEIASLEEDHQQEVASLEQEIEELKQWRFLGMALSGIGIIVAVGSIAGMYIWRKRSLESFRDRLKRTISSELNDISETDPGREVAVDVGETVADEFDRDISVIGARDETPNQGEFGDTDDGFGDTDDEFGDREDKR